jgi:hypothetical protein
VCADCAAQAEMKILKLEGENAAQRAVLRRREEEKAAVQRRTRDVALLSAAAGERCCNACWAAVTRGAAKDRPVGMSKERVDTKALAQKVDRFRLRRWKMLLERELELHSRRHEQAQNIGRDEMALNKLKKTLEELSRQRDALQLRLNRAATDGEGDGDDGADRLQEVLLLLLLLLRLRQVDVGAGGGCHRRCRCPSRVRRALHML